MDTTTNISPSKAESSSTIPLNSTPLFSPASAAENKINRDVFFGSMSPISMEGNFADMEDDDDDVEFIIEKPLEFSTAEKLRICKEKFAKIQIDGLRTRTFQLEDEISTLNSLLDVERESVFQAGLRIAELRTINEGLEDTIENEGEQVKYYRDQLTQSLEATARIMNERDMVVSQLQAEAAKCATNESNSRYYSAQLEASEQQRTYDTALLTRQLYAANDEVIRTRAILTQERNHALGYYLSRMGFNASDSLLSIITDLSSRIHVLTNQNANQTQTGGDAQRPSGDDPRRPRSPPVASVNAGNHACYNMC